MPDSPDVELSAAVEAYLRAAPQIERDRKEDSADVDIVGRRVINGKPAVCPRARDVTGRNDL